VKQLIECLVENDEGQAITWVPARFAEVGRKIYLAAVGECTILVVTKLQATPEEVLQLSQKQRVK
jgi:hypothetical protein